MSILFFNYRAWEWILPSTAKESHIFKCTNKQLHFLNKNRGWIPYHLPSSRWIRKPIAINCWKWQYCGGFLEYINCYRPKYNEKSTLLKGVNFKFIFNFQFQLTDRIMTWVSYFEMCFLQIEPFWISLIIYCMKVHTWCLNWAPTKIKCIYFVIKRSER